MVTKVGGVGKLAYIACNANAAVKVRYQEALAEKAQAGPASKAAPIKSGKFLAKSGEAARAAGADFRYAFRFLKNHFAPFTRYARDENGAVRRNVAGEKVKAQGLQHLRSGIGHRITQGIIAAPVVAVGAPLVAAAAAAVVGVAVPVALVGLVGLGIYGAFRSAFQGIRNTKTYQKLKQYFKAPAAKQFQTEVIPVSQPKLESTIPVVPQNRVVGTITVATQTNITEERGVPKSKRDLVTLRPISFSDKSLNIFPRSMVAIKGALTPIAEEPEPTPELGGADASEIEKKKDEHLPGELPSIKGMGGNASVLQSQPLLPSIRSSNKTLEATALPANVVEGAEGDAASLDSFVSALDEAEERPKLNNDSIEKESESWWDRVVSFIGYGESPAEDDLSGKAV